MIGTIRKHSSWLWMIIIVVTIFTFVYWGSQSTRFSDRGRGGNYGSIDGEPISKDQIMQAHNEAVLRYFLTYGAWPDSEVKRAAFDEQHETYQWLFFLKKLRDNDIQIDSGSVARAASAILYEVGRANTPEGEQPRAVPFDAFVQQVLNPHGITAEDFERFVRHDLGIEQLVSIISMSGKLITPQEAQFVFERDHQKFAAQAVFFSGTNFLSRVTSIRPEAVMEFYTNEMAAYRLPDRVQVNYVAFEFSNYLGEAARQVTNLNADVEATLARLGTNYLRFGKTPDAARSRIRQEYLRRQAMADAEKSANDFESDLFKLEPPATNLTQLAQSKGLTVKATSPFDEENGPADFDGGPNFAKAAFSLGPDKVFPEEPLVGENAVYVIAFDKRFPAEILPVKLIRDQLIEDYRRHQAMLLARAAGEDFERAATNGLAHGKTFDAICAEAGVKAETIPTFTLDTREMPEVEAKVDPAQFKQVAANTPTRTVSQFSSTHDGGFVVYVANRIPVDEATLKAGLPAFTKLLQQARQQEALNLWLSKEASISLRNTPLAQRNQQAPGAPGDQQAEP